MRSLVLVVLVGSIMAFAVSGLGRHCSVYAQRGGGSATGDLIALSSDASEGRQQVTVIDPQTRVMSVYHISHEGGTITLMSVRSIQADLLMDEYNTDSPLPREIRAILKQR